MPAGFQSWTNGTTIQIDSSYPVLSYRQQGNASLSAIHPASAGAGWSTIARYVDITIQSSAVPHIAIYGPSSYGVIACTKSGTSWTFRIVGITNQTVGNAPFTWLHFDEPVSRASGAGAESFNDAGKCLFSSYCPPIIVRAFQGTGLSTEGFATGLPSSRKYAAIFSANIQLEETTEHYTNQQVATYWSYELHTAYCQITPNVYNSAIKECGYGVATINAGVNEGSQSPAYPGGDLGGWGSATSALIIDVTDFV